MSSRTFALVIFSLMIVPNVGCQSWYNVRDAFYYCEPIDEAIHSYNCNAAAKRAWAARQDHYCGRERFDHFGAGFRAGYADVARGGRGCPPPLPPRCYWGWRYKNCEGQQCVASWFDGYPAGARAAEEDGVSNWTRMQTSYIVDAEYAARMPGARRGGPLPPVGFPGEEVLEEVPVAPVGVPEGQVPAPADVQAAPEGVSAPTTEPIEEVRAIRSFGEPTPAQPKAASLPRIVTRPKIVAAPAKAVVNAGPASQPVVVPQEETPAFTQEVQSPIRDLDLESTSEVDSTTPEIVPETPAVEMLSGVMVPKKQSPLVEEAAPPTIREIELDSALEVEASVSEQGDKPALIRTPSLAPIIAPAKPASAPPVAGIVEETPAYSLDNAADASDSVTPPSTKRSLPPIIPAKPKKQTPPIVRPVEEHGKFTKQEVKSPARQVSFESDDEEAPVLRRIGLSK